VRGPGRDRSDGGFTLIELGVSLLIVGILVALAFPTYMGFVAKTRDKQMQADLMAAFHVQALLQLEQGAFTDEEAVLLDLEPTLRYSAAGASGAVTVITRDPATAGVCLFGWSLSGRWFALHYSAYGAVHFAEAAPEPCTAGLVAGWSRESW
jgi:prepilin-type N-terminal cleavage/methylation domain-containing protein